MKEYFYSRNAPGHETERQDRPRFRFFAPEHIRSLEEAKERLIWVPRKKDVMKIFELARAVHEKIATESRDELWIMDIGGRGGFFGKLLVDEARANGINLHAVIVDHAENVLRDAANYYKDRGEKNMHFVVSAAEESVNLFNRKFDLIINGWMPTEVDLGKDIRKIESDARIYIRDVEGESAGMPAAYGPGKDFLRLGGWRGLHNIDAGMMLEHGWEPDRPINAFDVQLSKRIATPEFRKYLLGSLRKIDESHVEKNRMYPWEARFKDDYPFMHFKKGLRFAEDF